LLSVLGHAGVVLASTDEGGVALSVVERVASFDATTEPLPRNPAMPTAMITSKAPIAASLTRRPTCDGSGS
jgi:hypothetical protein